MPKHPAKLKARYLSLRSKTGLSQAQAARECKIARSTAHVWDHDLPSGVSTLGELTNRESRPPKVFDDLSDLGKRALRDIEVFGTEFFGLRIPHWWKVASHELVDAVLSPEQVFELFHAPTGAGKTTLAEVLVMWLLTGGGSCDPVAGRKLRFMFGSATYAKAVRSVDRIRRILQFNRPYYDADHSLVEVFGRYRPSSSEGDDESVWQQAQFTVAAVGDDGLFQRDPTVAAYSLGGSPLQSRVDVAVIDDPAQMKTLADESLVERFEAEFESRIEPAGTLFAVGQRLDAHDLYGSLASRVWTDDLGEQHPVYKILKFPAHFDGCDGTHREWDGSSGCLLDAVRLPYRKLQREMPKPSFQAMYQQNAEASSALGIVDLAWINGGVDSAGLEAIGCLDRDRAFWEPIPAVNGRLVTYLTVDPAEGSTERYASWWSLEVWQLDPMTRVRSLLFGTRGRWTFSEVLSHSGAQAESGGFSGVLEDIVFKAASVGARLAAVVIEQNKIKGFLVSSDFQRWHRERWPDLKVIAFQTGANKSDPVLGVRPLLADGYRNGTARWPWKTHGNLDALDYLRVKLAELTHVRPKTDDTVMSEWIGAASMDDIILAGSRTVTNPAMPTDRLPPYLRRRQREALIDRSRLEGPEELSDEAKRLGAEPVPSGFRFDRSGNHIVTSSR